LFRCSGYTVGICWSFAVMHNSMYFIVLYSSVYRSTEILLFVQNIL